MDESAITFRAQTTKFTTLVDGTRRVYLDLLGDTPYSTDAKLIETQQPGIILECAIVAINQKPTDDKRKPTKPRY